MSRPSSERRPSAKEKIARLRAEETRRKRRRLRLAGIAAAVVVIGAAVGITLAVTGGSATGGSVTGGQTKLAALSTLGTLRPAPASGPLGPEGVPVPAAAALAGPGTAAAGQAVDGIGCNSAEQSLFHIHAHLTIFVNGSARQIPAAIGIPGAQAQQSAAGPFIATGNCFYWLHTHAADGIVHIESPVQRTYTLGNFFDEWGQPLGPSQVGPAAGHVVALYNGQVYQGNPRNIPLTAHADIRLEVGTPLIAPQTISWPSNL